MAPMSGSSPQQRVGLPVAVGSGMYKSGDWGKIPPDATPKAKNVFVRPGPRVEKRDGWLRETTLPANTTEWTRLFIYRNDFGLETLIPLGVDNTGAGGAKRNFDGSYTTNAALVSSHDYANHLGKIFGVVNFKNIITSDLVHAWSFDGLNYNANAFNSHLAGATICSFNHRLFIGNIADAQSSEITTQGYKFEDNTIWTLVGGPPTVAVSGTLRTLTIVGATDTVKTTAAVYTAGASDEFVTIQPKFRSYDPLLNLPFTITVEDAAGANIYGALELVVYNRTSQPDWQNFVMSARIPATTAIYIKIKPGITSAAAVAGKVDVADNSNNNTVWSLVSGHRPLPIIAPGVNIYSNSLQGNVYPYRFMWSEVDDPTDWRAVSFYDCKEVAGAITVIRALNDRFCVFKNSAIWLFQSQDNPSLPIVFQDLVFECGCVGPQAIVEFENEFWFIGPNEVYRWTVLRYGVGEGRPMWPVPLAGPGQMREELFNSTTVATPIVAVNQLKRQLYCYLQPGKIHVYDMDANDKHGAWSYITITGANDAELTISDMCYTNVGGTPEIWATMAQSPDVVKLRAGQRRDSVVAAGPQPVTSEYWFRPFQTKEPRYTFLAESLEIDHGVTASQANSTLTFEVSHDGGQTFGTTKNVTANLADGNYEPMQVPLWDSYERMIVGLKHVGDAGPDAFNLSGGTLMAQILGEKIQRLNPTPV